ncbi:MAG: mercury methylation corrinoid protein HgcA [Pseudomonadota bacterium]
MSLPSLDQPFVIGSIQTRVGPIPQVSSSLARADRWGSAKARWGVGRMHYTVEPGLYALRNPDEHAPVLVTANYKMSFDRLREALPGRNLWILVLDTKGINVWCAAGKGTFGTEELVRRISSSGLEQIVSHRELILPQLAGPGVAAHLVKKLSGFKVIYGPIRAKDLPTFLEAGLKATPEMRQKTFTIRERVVLIPIELVDALKWTVMVLPAFFVLGGLGAPAAFWFNALNYGIFAIVALLAALVAGSVLTPLLLPWLPGRAFSIKGLEMGLVTALILSAFRAGNLGAWQGRLEILGWFLMIPALSAFLAMNFTGASTYTSLSGVKKEMKWAVPFEIAGGATGLCLWLGSRFTA